MEKITKEMIISNCIQYAVDNNLHLCGKQPVYVVIVTKDSQYIFGSNYRKNNVDCNRIKFNCVSGFGYEHCDAVCEQWTHAERVAIAIAKEKNSDIVGGTLYLTGHSYCCASCKEAMLTAGITNEPIFV